MINIKKVHMPENMGQVDFIKFATMLESAVKETVRHARNLTIKEMLRPKTGILYSYGRASAVGETPGIKKGLLSSNLWYQTELRPDGAYGSVFVNEGVPYANVLEDSGRPIFNDVVETVADLYFDLQLRDVIERVIVK